MILSHANMLTGCPLDANNINIIKFRAYRRLICCYLSRMSRETWVGKSMAFSSSMKIFLIVCTRHAWVVHVYLLPETPVRIAPTTVRLGDRRLENTVFFPMAIYFLRPSFSLPPSRNSDPGSHSRLFCPALLRFVRCIFIA